MFRMIHSSRSLAWLRQANVMSNAQISYKVEEEGGEKAQKPRAIV